MRYFSCRENHGVFASRHKISPVGGWLRIIKFDSDFLSYMSDTQAFNFVSKNHDAACLFVSVFSGWREINSSNNMLTAINTGCHSVRQPCVLMWNGPESPYYDNVPYSVISIICSFLRLRRYCIVSPSNLTQREDEGGGGVVLYCSVANKAPICLIHCIGCR